VSVDAERPDETESVIPTPLTGRICLADVVPEHVQWLWPGRIPVGKIVTLDGDPGLGKSAIALTMAAVVSRGGTWPDGTRCDEPGDVLVMTAEDGVADTIRPRLDAAGADSHRVHAIEHGFNDRGEPQAITLGDIQQLERHVTETNARLLIVDVLMAYMPGDAHKDQDVRKALTPFAKLAERTGCSMLLLRHLKKNAGGEPVYLGGGSIGIVGAARAGFMVTRDPDRPEDVRILASVKSNLAKASASLAYRLIEADNGCVAVEWLGEDQRSATDLLGVRSTNIGENSSQVLNYVNGRPTTKSADVADVVGMTRKLANQHLNRLHGGGLIRKISRGVYEPLNGSATEPSAGPPSEGTEGIEDVEDSEDFSDQDLENPQPGLIVCVDAMPDQPNPHNLQDLHAVVGDADTCDVKISTCPECGESVGSTGRCVPCVLKHARVTVASQQAGELSA
jgi:hypothetical protein